MKSTAAITIITCILAVTGKAGADVVIEIPMDEQINLGDGDAIYIPGGSGWLTFENDNTEGWTRRHMAESGWYNLEIDLVLAGVGEVDMSGTDDTIEFDCRYHQDNSNPYADAPIFVRIFTTDGAMRDYGIVYQTGWNWWCDPVELYPAWVHVTIQVNDLNADYDCDGNPDVTQSSAFDPAHVSRIQFYGTDWSYVSDAADWIDVKDLRIVAQGTAEPPEAYTVTPVLFVPDPNSFPEGYQPSAAELEEDLANITETMERIRVWYGDALGLETSLRVNPVVHMSAFGGLSDYDIEWVTPSRRYRDGIVLGNTWGTVIGEVGGRGYGPGSSSVPRMTIIFCKGAGGFAGGAQWYNQNGGGMCMLGDWCLDSLAERVPLPW